MRVIAELVGICAGATVIATYLGVNIKHWLAAHRDQPNRDKEDPWAGS